MFDFGKQVLIALVVGITAEVLGRLFKRIAIIAPSYLVLTFGKHLVQEWRDYRADKAKRNFKILFVDDDSKFKVVSILRRAGWVNTSVQRDIESLDEPALKKVDLFFVDIHGVGKALSFKDEGLGLAKAIKERFPKKFVVIYSAETKGERFHEALKIVDDSLAKNSDPYVFQNLVESFSKIGK